MKGFKKGGFTGRDNNLPVTDILTEEQIEFKKRFENHLNDIHAGSIIKRPINSTEKPSAFTVLFMATFGLKLEK